MTIERYRRSAVDGYVDVAARAIAYTQDVVDRSWSALPPPVARQVVQRLGRIGMPLPRTWADIAWPDVIRRRPDGSAYRQRLGWCIGELGVVLLDARQAGVLDGRRFRPKGVWDVRTIARSAEQAQVRQHVESRHRSAVTRREPHDGPVPGYAGGEPEVWSALPGVVRAGMQHYLPDAAVRQEWGEAQIDWLDGQVTERVWYERRDRDRATGVAMIRRTRTTRPLTTWDDAAAAVRDAAWTVSAWRCELADAVGVEDAARVAGSSRAPLEGGWR